MLHKHTAKYAKSCIFIYSLFADISIRDQYAFTEKCSLSVITLWVTTSVKWRIFPQNDTNATLKHPSKSSLHRPSLFNCKKSPTSHIFDKNKKRRQDNSNRQTQGVLLNAEKLFLFIIISNHSIFQIETLDFFLFCVILCSVHRR